MTKKVAIMQPYFFPYIGYWQLINAVDEFVVYDDVNFIKGGWINRNNILSNGQKQLLTLPLSDASSFKKINEIDIVESALAKILRKINYAYSKAQFFCEISPIIEKILNSSKNIAQLNYNAIVEIVKYLEISTKILLSSNLSKNNELKAQNKVIDICKNLDANIYINAIGGVELYDKESFKSEGIELNFIKMKDIKYNQLSNQFVENLSIIDVLMFNSKEQINEMLNNYELM